jgi:hypothetical protein
VPERVLLKEKEELLIMLDVFESVLCGEGLLGFLVFFALKFREVL